MTRSRVRTRRPLLAGCLLAAVALLATSATPVSAAETTTRVDGQLPSGATYMMEVPADWNGTVLLFSHGIRRAGSANPAQNAPDDTTRALLLDDGYALIGSSYASTDWAVTDAVPDQLATLDAFTARFGQAGRTIAWGRSFGGLVTTVIAERHANRIDGSLALCGIQQGGTANYNNALDTVFALKTLLAPDRDIPLTGLPDKAAATAAADAMTDVVTTAQQTPAGRARVALAAALRTIPVWNSVSQPRPAADDWVTQQANQYAGLKAMLQGPAFLGRQEVEARAGGNVSWNTGVDYSRLLPHSMAYREVTQLYKAAGLSLRDDLDALDEAPRINATPEAAEWMIRTSVFTGELAKPQLTIHTVGDGVVPVQAENAYHRAVTAAGSAGLLRQAYVDNAGHCQFSPAEQLAALHTLENRIDTGRWHGTGADALNARAAASDPTTPARYVRYRPTAYLRPYDLAHPADQR